MRSCIESEHCIVCGNEFIPYRINDTICSAECNRKHEQQKEGQKVARSIFSVLIIGCIMSLMLTLVAYSVVKAGEPRKILIDQQKSLYINQSDIQDERE